MAERPDHPVPAIHLGGPAIRAEGVVRRYGHTVALDGVDLEVRAGEVYGFLGPNGAGKSTLVRILCTLLRANAGRAWVGGFDVATQVHELRRHIGVALQEAALDDRATGRELLTLQGRLYGLRAAMLKRRIADVLHLVDIGSAIDRRVGTYSGGMKRRLDLAAALVHGPEILFLDEPTTGLDPESRARVWAEIERLNGELGMTIFLTTQYLEEADALAGRVGIICEGRIVAEGTPQELKHAVGKDVIVAEVEGDDPGALARIGEFDLIDNVSVSDDKVVVVTPHAARVLTSVATELDRSKLSVRSITSRTPTLDDVFWHYTGSQFAGSGAR